MMGVCFFGGNGDREVPAPGGGRGFGQIDRQGGRWGREGGGVGNGIVMYKRSGFGEFVAEGGVL